MHVFVTGSTGWVGLAVVKELLASDHRVFGLVRSKANAQRLSVLGAHPVHGTLDSMDVLRQEASRADVVIHTAFHHDFSKFAQSAEQDRLAIEALGSELRADARLIVTSGLMGLAEGRAVVETDTSAPGSMRQSESAARLLASQGRSTCTIRLPPSVHGAGDHAFIPYLISLAKQRRVSAYIGQGENLWCGVHRDDAARLFCTVAELKKLGPVYHAVEDRPVSFKSIAETIGRRLGVPVEPREPDHFGWMGGFAGADVFATTDKTKADTGWAPQGPSLLEDIDQDAYFRPE